MEPDMSSLVVELIGVELVLAIDVVLLPEALSSIDDPQAARPSGRARARLTRAVRVRFIGLS
jgi:hypothetical protein